MKNLFTLIILFSSVSLRAQNVGIGTDKPEKSAILDLNSSNQGLLMPRLTKEKLDQIEKPAKGLMVYQTDSEEGFYYYNGTKWNKVLNQDAEKSVLADPNDWTISGNANAVATSFLGTTNAIPLNFKVNNTSVASFPLPTSRNIYLGNTPTTVTTGTDNYLVGYGALTALTTGAGNIAIGSNSLSLVSSGNYNIGIGQNALNKVTTGSFNLAVGLDAGNAITTAVNNVAVGGASLLKTTTGASNTGVGANALRENTLGQGNVAVGSSSMYFNISGSWNLAVGASSLWSNTSGANNTAVGSNSLLYNTTGYVNSALGVGALAYNTTAYANSAFGERALGNLKTGIDNVGMGNWSAYHNALGSGNVAIGRDALRSSFAAGQNQGSNTRSLNRNVSIGTRSGYTNIGNDNVFLGYEAGYTETGSNMLYVSNKNTANPLLKGDFLNKYIRLNVGPTNSPTAGYLAVGDFDATTPMTIPTGYRLVVQEGIITEKLKITPRSSSFWADYVFEKDYKLIPLSNLENYIKENKHLPNIPSTAEVQAKGIDIAELNAKLLEKIEELTLYIIEQDKRLKALEVGKK